MINLNPPMPYGVYDDSGLTPGETPAQADDTSPSTGPVSGDRSSGTSLQGPSATNDPRLIPGPQFGMNEIIDAFTQSVMEKNDKKWSPIRPSAAGKCEMELGYEQMEFRGHATYKKEQKTSSVHRLLNFGHSVERHVIDEMYKAFAQSPEPIVINYKQHRLDFGRMPDGSMLEGSMDLGVEMGKWKIAYDIKSKGDKYSQFYKSSWDEFVEKLEATGFAVKFGDDAVYITDTDAFLASGFDPFFLNNIHQLNFYVCNKFLVERGYNLAGILQLNKNDSRLREIRFTPSQKAYEATKAKFERVIRTVDEDKSPLKLTKEFTLGSMKCGFCAFRGECYPEEDALKTYFRTLPPKQWAKDLDRLPQKAQDELRPLFEMYMALGDTLDKQEKTEEKIIKILDSHKVYKVKLNKDQVYQMKRLKSGGPGGGERYVLRRSKE